MKPQLRTHTREKLPVAIIGSGNIGSDLLVKVERSEWLSCTLFVGQNPESAGILRAKERGVRVSHESLDGLLKHSGEYALVFDATSAAAHKIHAKALRSRGIFTIDMTPSRVGVMCAPVLNVHHAMTELNVNMISCGGQATAPLVKAIMSVHPETSYVELVSSIASRSAGIGTRDNIDEYTQTTCDALITLGGAPKAKAIVILNPAEPPIHMHNTLYALIPKPDLSQLTKAIAATVKNIQAYVPGYTVTLGPVIENGRVTVMTEVVGRGDVLPKYAGNLDIINCAAIAVAEHFAKSQKKKSKIKRTS